MKAGTPKASMQKYSQYMFRNESCHELPNYKLLNLSKTSLMSKTKMTTKDENIEKLEQMLKPKNFNKALKQISTHQDFLKKKPELVNSILKLKQMNLLKQKNLYISKHSEQSHNNPVYNDYHSRQTNPGYSRNKLGGFFTK